jgi:hypothetical protein
LDNVLEKIFVEHSHSVKTEEEMPGELPHSMSTTVTTVTTRIITLITLKLDLMISVMLAKGEVVTRLPLTLDPLPQLVRDVLTRLLW